ncbi:uncharacterized protein LOC124349431 [Daphnia pulicaria]|uniref:uncharacterized protein LOC124349431 n=1 Tax=Daphnia pulicaria TaxID=35523 RepID=UPI001EE9F538|nr:uncharacterized protein LOC124349431 [Daphnia pulicaria]
MTLIDLKVKDTGYYRCEGTIPLYGRKRFVYVSSTEKLIFITNGNYYANSMSEKEIKNDNSRTISFVTTHPNVSISLFKDGTKRDTYLEVWNSSNKNSRWSFDPRNGLTLQNPTVFDSGFYYVFAHLLFVNGKPVNITLSDRYGQITKQLIRRIFPVDRIDVIDEIEFHLVVKGNQNCDITLV